MADIIKAALITLIIGAVLAVIFHEIWQLVAAFSAMFFVGYLRTRHLVDAAETETPSRKNDEDAKQR